MQKIDILEVTGIRVLTTKQIAEAYGVTKDKIIYNFNYNKERYVLGKHYIEVSGDELRRLKRTCENQISFKYAKSLYLWTEKGALLHAKSLNTDKAWEVYDYLVDFYFRVKEEKQEVMELTYQEKRGATLAEARAKAEEKRKELNLLATPSKHCMRTVVDVPENPKAQDAIKEIKKAIAAIEVMLDESNRYVSEESYRRYRNGVADSFQALMTRVTRYLEIVPKMIEKQY